MKTLRLLPLLLAACTVGPDHTDPTIDLPKSFPAANAAAGSLDQTGIEQWWFSLGDDLLASLVERALATGADLRIAAARVQAARARRGIAGAAGLPTLDALGGARERRLSGNGLFVPPQIETRTVYELGFDSSWEIDLFGRVARGVEAADAELAATEASAQDVRVRLAAEVARTYLELRTAAARQAIARTALQVQAETTELVRARVAAGVATELDLARAEALRDTTGATIPDLEAAWHDAAQTLAVLLGTPPAELAAELRLATAPYGGPAVLAAGLPHELLRRRPDVRAAERDLAAHAARIGIATADLYPRLSLTGQFALQSTSSGSLLEAASRTFDFGPSLRLPLFRGGQLRAAVAAREAEHAAAIATYERAVRQAFADVETALVRFARAQERRFLLERAVTAQARSVALAKDLYQNGVADFTSVLDAERELCREQDRLAQTDGDIATLRIAVYKALGGGWTPPPEVATAGN